MPGFENKDQEHQDQRPKTDRLMFKNAKNPQLNDTSQR